MLDKELKKKNSFVSRWGGEEFAAILIDKPVPDDIQIADDLRKKVKDLNIPNEK